MAFQKSSYGIPLVIFLLVNLCIRIQSAAIDGSQESNPSQPFEFDDEDDKSRFTLLAWRALQPAPVLGLNGPLGNGGKKRTFTSAGLKQFLFNGRQDVRLGRR